MDDTVDDTHQKCVYAGGSLSSAGEFYARRLLAMGFSTRTPAELLVVQERYPDIKVDELFKLVPKDDLLWWLTYLGSLMTPRETEDLVGAATPAKIH